MYIVPLQKVLHIYFIPMREAPGSHTLLLCAGGRHFPLRDLAQRILPCCWSRHTLAQVPTQSVENHYGVMRKMKQWKFYKLQGDAEKLGAVNRASQLGLFACQPSHKQPLLH